MGAIRWSSWGRASARYRRWCRGSTAGVGACCAAGRKVANIRWTRRTICSAAMNMPTSPSFADMKVERNTLSFAGIANRYVLVQRGPHKQRTSMDQRCAGSANCTTATSFDSGSWCCAFGAGHSARKKVSPRLLRALWRATRQKLAAQPRAVPPVTCPRSSGRSRRRGVLPPRRRGSEPGSGGRGLVRCRTSFLHVRPPLPHPR